MGLRSSRYWTGIGSRRTPDDILELMVYLGKLLTDKGGILRSGGALGADTAFYAGALQSTNFKNAVPEIYLSWAGMRGLYPDKEMGLIDSKMYPNWEKASDLACSMRNGFYGLEERGISHHTRNVFQILGTDLETPSRFVIFWAPPTKDQSGKTLVKGGTNTAIRLAVWKHIPVINLYTNEGYNRALKMLDKHKVKHHFKYKP